MFLGTVHYLNLSASSFRDDVCTHACVFSMCVDWTLLWIRETCASCKNCVSWQYGGMAAYGFRQKGLSCQLCSASTTFPTPSCLQVPEKAGLFASPRRTFCKWLPVL